MMTLKEIEARCENIFSKAGYQWKNANINLSINSRLTKTLGRCKYKRSIIGIHPTDIEISKQLLENASEKDIYDVIDHECCHALVTLSTNEKHGHNNEFKNMCKLVGTSNDEPNMKVTYNVDESKIYKYFAICKECGTKVKYHRAGKIIKYPELFKCSCGGDIYIQQNW